MEMCDSDIGDSINDANIVEKIKIMLISSRLYRSLYGKVYGELKHIVKLLNCLQNIDDTLHNSGMFMLYKSPTIVEDDIINTFINVKHYNPNHNDPKVIFSVIRNIINYKIGLYFHIYLLMSIYVNSDDIMYNNTHVKYFAYFGNMEMVEKLNYYNDNEKDNHDNPDICAYIAGSGNLKLLEWAYEDGYVCDSSATIAAELNGHTNCLEYLKSVNNTNIRFINKNYRSRVRHRSML